MSSCKPIHWQLVLGNFVDISDDFLADIQENLASVLDVKVKCGVLKSSYFGLTVDQNTDITVQQKVDSLRSVRCWWENGYKISDVKIQTCSCECNELRLKYSIRPEDNIIRRKIVGTSDTDQSIRTGDITNSNIRYHYNANWRYRQLCEYMSVPLAIQWWLWTAAERVHLGHSVIV